MKFSIIIPAYNAARFLPDCLRSLAAQDYPPEDFEVLVADDASTDATAEVAAAFAPSLSNMRVLRRSSNEGPGAGRNAGLDAARGEWVLFVDSDDELAADCLRSLDAFIAGNGADLALVGFNWSAISADMGLNSSKRVGRRDGSFLGDRERLLEQYLCHRMDGSVIYTAARRELIERHALRFPPGLHEDVDFIFKLYYHAPRSAYCDKVLYRKRGRNASIINTISSRHIDGYFRAWAAIADHLRSVETSPEVLARRLQAHAYGSIGAIATRVREVIRHCSDAGETERLLEEIRPHAEMLSQAPGFEAVLPGCKTLYGSISRLFLEAARSSSDRREAYLELGRRIRELEGKSWSCVDLHHSVFMRPDQVRTCCKRFFVEGEMRGDVVLYDLPEDRRAKLSAGQILEAKRELHQKINSGLPCACDGCPFLEFRDWGPFNRLDIRYLSLEYHSVCNLRCTYCGDDYFGGRKASFDLKGSMEDFLEAGALDRCAIVVWGGGEPVIGEHFGYLVDRLARALPGTQQRVLTNSTKTAPEVEALLRDRKGQVVTSVDAGTEAGFARIRGKQKLRTVLENLRRYSAVNPSRVTVKYIFTEGNAAAEEVAGFASLVAEYGLQRCFFQISGDFKQESIAPETAFNMMLMFGLLRKAGCGSVYFDELLWHRLSELHLEEHAPRLRELSGHDFIASAETYPSVVVWGTGLQAKYLLGKSRFFKQARVDFFVDATPEKQGRLFFGKETRDPVSLRECDRPVVIAAVQGYPLIVEQFRALGLPETRLVRELII